MKELEPKQAMIARKLFELNKEFSSDSVIVDKFLNWFKEMEKQNWNGIEF
jgi:hypothetical protein|tara:strand:- start:95 stop:244 length:150 start_codon:yes stop_codon:yes gene_type:complete